MGEIADDMIDGRCCALCGEYFIAEDINGHDKGYSHGYPVACNSCWTIDCGYEKQDKNCST